MRGEGLVNIWQMMQSELESKQLKSCLGFSLVHWRLKHAVYLADLVILVQYCGQLKPIKIKFSMRQDWTSFWHRALRTGTESFLPALAACRSLLVSFCFIVLCYRVWFTEVLTKFLREFLKNRAYCISIFCVEEEWYFQFISYKTEILFFVNPS